MIWTWIQKFFWKNLGANVGTDGKTSGIPEVLDLKTSGILKFYLKTSGIPEVLPKISQENHSLYGSRVIRCKNEVRNRIVHYELLPKRYQHELKILVESI